MWADNITFDFEDDTAHRTSGNNSYANNSYTENGINIALTYADAVTSGTPLSGSANVLGRVAKNTTNSPIILIGPIDNTNNRITSISYKVKGVAAMSLDVDYSTNGTSWSSLQNVASMPTSVETKNITGLNKTDATVYLRFTVSVASTTNSNRDFQMDDIVITYESASDPRAATTVTLNTGYSTEAYMGENIVSPSLNKVSTASADIDGATVAWSSTNENVATIANDGTITLVGPGTTKIKANYAGDANNYKPSEASYDLAVYASYSGIEALQAAATSTSTKMKVNFTDAVVTAIKGNNAYIVEGEKGAIIFTANHGLTAGKVINGALKANVVLYGGATEITNYSSTGLTITDGSVPDAAIKTIGNLSAINTGLIVTINELTYDATNTRFSDGTNTIAFYDAFGANPTLEDGKTYNVTGMVNYYNKLQISPLAASGIAEVTNKTTPTSSWQIGGNDVTSTVFTKGGNFSASFVTNSTGDKSFESSNTAVATVDANGVITLTGTVGIATITATTAANSSWFVSNASLTITVCEPVEDGVFNFGNYQDYGSGIVPGDTYYADEETWTAGGIKLKTVGKYRWYIGTNGLDLKLYSKKDGENKETTKITIEAPTGKKLTKFVITGSSFGSMTADKGTYNAGTWTGSEDDVTMTYGGSGTIGISTITIYYSEPTISVTLPAAGYMTYCNVGAALDFTGIKAYKVSAVGETSVTLEEITEAPANTPVILEASEGSHNLSVVASAASVGTNKLRVSDGTKTTTAEKIVYALAKKNSTVGFYKVQAGVNVPEGKCYIEVNAPTNPAPEFLGFNGETTGINEVRGKMEELRGKVYNLAGQRVAQPTKGLYIVNGKKVVIK